MPKNSPDKTSNGGKELEKTNQKARNLNKKVKEAPNSTSKINFSLKRENLKEYKKSVKAKNNKNTKKYKFTKYPINNPAIKKERKMAKPFFCPK